MHKVLMAAASAALVAATAGQALAESSTTRIETRPYYGATVTIESGVRVFRAIPPTRNMIINPHGATPLQLGINETRVHEESTSHNYFYDEGGSGQGYYPVGAAGLYGGWPPYGRKGLRGRGHKPGGVGVTPRGGHRYGGHRGGHRH